VAQVDGGGGGQFDVVCVEDVEECGGEVGGLGGFCGGFGGGGRVLVVGVGCEGVVVVVVGGGGGGGGVGFSFYCYRWLWLLVVVREPAALRRSGRLFVASWRRERGPPGRRPAGLLLLLLPQNGLGLLLIVDPQKKSALFAHRLGACPNYIIYIYILVGFFPGRGGGLLLLLLCFAGEGEMGSDDR
jgi:hypothetical protein